MASSQNSVCCSLCTASLVRKSDCRRIFSDCSVHVLPLFSDIMSKSFGRDALHGVFTEDSRLCHPCFHRLERIGKMREELQKEEEELTQQVRRLGELQNFVSDQRIGKVMPSTPTKILPSTDTTKEFPAVEERTVSFQSSTPVRSAVQLMRRKANHHRSPSVAVNERTVSFQSSTPVRSALQLMRRKANHHHSPSVAVSYHI